MALDIHHFNEQFDRADVALGASGLSERNVALIRGYRNTCLLQQTCGKVRLIRVMRALMVLGKLLGKDFDQVTRADLEALLGQLLIRQPSYSPQTIATYKKILRRFLSWVFVPNEFPKITKLPDQIAWITGHVRRVDRQSLQRNELLTPEDIEHLVTVARNARDRALISTLWETGARVSEIGNCRIKDVNPAPHGFTVDITGKTGTRSPLVVSATPYLSEWLGLHPTRDQRESPLWVASNAKHLTYRAISNILQRVFARAGITKPFHPHIFRHSRATFVLANGIMNESQCKQYFGWTAGSDMLATYAHLIDNDANNAILRENHLTPAQRVRDELQPRTCRICQALNPPRSEYCQRCHAVLDLARAYEHQQLHDLKEQLFANMFKLMVERGLVDEAAREIHDANLGGVLKRLAQHATGEQPIGERKDAARVKENVAT